jgi:hypothetical protein
MWDDVMATCSGHASENAQLARPGKFDEAVVSDAAIQCFWADGYEATSVRGLADEMGITGACNQSPRRAND